MIKTNVQSDGSIVFDVVIETDEQTKVVFNMVSLESAERLDIILTQFRQSSCIGIYHDRV